ncbi:MAG: DNA-binding response regulator [Calditrichaeota bacterium]|nr:MAG: DNA-binding response regulator [Calditrichota bacterium]
MKILIVEDNQHLASDTQQFLTENGYLVEHVAMLIAASEKISTYNYDVVVLDLGLPDGNGLQLIPEIKEKNPETGILIVTAKNSLNEKVEGLEIGADDYITKPFHKAELNARIRSIIRRRNSQGSNILKFNEISIDLLSSQVFLADKLVSLTRKEYDLLVYFMYNQNRILTKENIAEHLWGDHFDQADSFDFIYNHIKNLRKKLTSKNGKNYIQVMYGIGYRFMETSK